jgi:transposase
MAYREVTMVEVKEVLRLWLRRRPKRAIARLVGISRNTVRSYLRAAKRCGLSPSDGESALSEELLADVLLRLNGKPERSKGESWSHCEAEREFIAKKLDDGLKLRKVQRLLQRGGVVVPYATLHRFAVNELDFGGSPPTIPVDDGEPGGEVQIDTGWMGYLEPDARGRRRRFRAWLFTPGVSRYRFLYPCFQETAETAIEACEAAWEFYGGVFGVLVPDNTKAIVQH